MMIKDIGGNACRSSRSGIRPFAPIRAHVAALKSVKNGKMQTAITADSAYPGALGHGSGRADAARAVERLDAHRVSRRADACLWAGAAPKTLRSRRHADPDPGRFRRAADAEKIAELTSTVRAAPTSPTTPSKSPVARASSSPRELLKLAAESNRRSSRRTVTSSAAKLETSARRRDNGRSSPTPSINWRPGSRSTSCRRRQRLCSSS